MSEQGKKPGDFSWDEKGRLIFLPKDGEPGNNAEGEPGVSFRRLAGFAFGLVCLGLIAAGVIVTYRTLPGKEGAVLSDN